MMNGEMELLKTHAMDFGVELTPTQLDLLRVYLDELWEWNSRINLTGLSRRERVVTELILDSLLPVPWLPDTGTLLDVGAGAGFPGVPLKICHPGLRTDLLEPHSKKASFLKQLIRALKLEGTRVLRGRIDEESIPLDSEGYNVITSRAVAGIGQIALWCAPFLKTGGLLVGFLGKAGGEDLINSLGVMRRCGLRISRKKEYILPGKKSRRMVVLFERTGDVEG